ncbi:MAG: hypothetical protein P8P49_04450 [Opitutales bacterium]|nr:hypothetical protein [Opitutales bacterium]
MSVSSDNPTSFNIFLDILEVYENLLHTETQAIAAKNLDEIESILAQKEESMKSVLVAKGEIDFDPLTNIDTKDLITRLIELQKRNAESFKRLIDSQSEKEKNSEFEKKPPKNHRLIKAYSSSMFNTSTRLN